MRLFFNYILNNKKYFEIVKSYFFKNSEIQFVFGIIRDYILKNSDASIPTPRQILDMVSLEDKEGVITREILKSILTDNIKDYDIKNFVEPKFNAWILTNRIKTGTVDIIEETRNFDNIDDFDSAIEAANKIRLIVDQILMKRICIFKIILDLKLNQDLKLLIICWVGDGIFQH